MKKAYFTVNIPAGEFTVEAATTNGTKLSYLDFFDRALLYRYFNPGEISIKRIPAKVAAKIKQTRESFASLQRYGKWR